MLKKMQSPDIDCLEYIGPLEVARSDGSASMQVPLAVAVDGDGETSAIRVFDGGVVWEDLTYDLSFEIHSTKAIRRTTLSVNDHTELHVHADFSTMYSGGDCVYRYEYYVDDSRSDHTVTHPFSLTCGFARIEVRVEFFNGPDAFLVTPDIVSLDEPRRKGQTGESAEEDNVRQMFRALTKVEGNQAAEWMFARGPVSLMHRRLSLDKNTDWAYAPFSVRLEVANDALHCIFDGLEDPGDAFPNSLEASDCREGENPKDTAENQAVRALLASMEDQIRRTRDTLHDMLAESEQLRDTLQSLISAECSLRSHAQSLPALQIIMQHVEREGELYFTSKDLHWRIAEMLTFVDDRHDGFGEVTAVPFHVPECRGLYASDPTYSRLHEAMRTWSVCAHEPLERTGASLHAIKPDRLFEYSALHKMLDWLWRDGFVENDLYERPVDRFAYTLEGSYKKYENETRSANTFHLVRRNDDGDTYVDLYYQPVLYLADHGEENGLDVHRVPRISPIAGEDDSGEFWTPDYLIDVQHGDERKTYLVDAKYCPARLLDRKMEECADKYVARSARGHGVAGTGIDGVALLAGRLDAPQLDVSTGQMDGRAYLRVIAPFNKNSGRRKVGSFFAALGLA